MRRYRRHRKGYTLIELVLAVAIMVLLSSTASTLISYAVRMRKLADAQADMYAVSIRLHKAISTELMGAGEVCLYQSGPGTYGTVPVTQRVLYLYEQNTNAADKVLYHTLVMGNSKSKSAKLLPKDKGFDSYNGVEVTSVTYQVMSITDHLNADTEDTATLFRCVKVTTVVTKDAWEYEHTSTIRFDEMVLHGNQVMVCTEKSPSTYSSGLSGIRVAKASDKDTTFTRIRYSIE